MKNLYFVMLGLVCCLWTGTLFAQDIHYSQTGNSPLNLNPALTGGFNGDHRLIGNFRNQWQVPVPYLQLAGSWDWRLRDREKRQMPVSVGAIFNYDRAGDAELSLAQLGLSASYAFRLSKSRPHFLTLAGNLGVAQRKFDPNKLQYASQYDFKEGYLSTNPDNENIARTTRSFADMGLGVNLRLQAHPDSALNRTKLDLGLGAFHLNEPDRSFLRGIDDPLPRRISVYGLGTLMLASRFDLLLQAVGQFQGPHQEIVLGAGGLIHLNQTPTQELALQVGLGYRLDDALIPWAGLHYQNWQFHFSYDLNTSPINKATLYRGGPEISVIYIIRSVPPMQYCRLCPTYM